MSIASCRKFFVLWLLAGVFSLRLVAAERVYSIPILLIDGENKGHCNHISFRYERIEGSSAPLRVSISDDTPSGSGSSIRNSVWMAAIAAAAHRDDMLNGVRITVDLSGFIDGPSAGGMLSLALLNALEQQKQFPEDFAMTGTILPDGTIGTVGGVAEKIRAAAERGIKRIVIPSFLRFEEQDDGSTVDLFRLGQELHVEIAPVENLEEAYCVLHRRAVPREKMISPKEVCRITPALEQLLLEQISEMDQAIREMEEQVPDGRSQLGGELAAMREFHQEAQQALQGGNLLAAHRLFRQSYLLCCGLSSGIRFLDKRLFPLHPVLRSSPGDSAGKKYRKALAAFHALNDKDAEALFGKNVSDALGGMIGGIGEMPDVSPAAGQLADFSGAAECIGIYVQCGLKIDEGMEDCDDKELEDYFELLCLQRFMLDCFPAYRKLEEQLLPPLAAAMPRRAANGRERLTEDFFYKAVCAVFDSVESEIIVPGARAEELDPDQMRQKLMITDGNYMTGEIVKGAAGLWHEAVATDDSPAAACRNTAILFAQIDALVGANAILIKHGPEMNSSQTESGDFVYGNSDFLHYLISSARNRAMRGIKACLDQRIPCLSAQMCFAAAENNREKQRADKVHEVLADYWMASLRAQALRMTCGSPQGENPSSR